MRIEHSGWNQEHGSFRYFVYVDDNKSDYEIRFRNGCCARQAEAFHMVTADWNYDGDVYPQYGAYFQCFDRNGEPDGGSFWTPEQMMEALIRGREGEDNGGYTVVDIPGIVIPDRDKRPSLGEQVAMSERQQMAQDIERNRKMNALGIRRPGEPWVR